MSHPLQLWTMRAVSVPYLCEARGGDYQVFGASPFGAHGRQLGPNSTPHAAGLPASAKEHN